MSSQLEAHTMINHEREPHCIGCYVIRWNGGEPTATCNECGYSPRFLDLLDAHSEFGRVDEGAVERLARFIYRKEAANCKTLDESLHHQSNWRRAIPEAREMLTAAIAGEKAGGA